VTQKNALGANYVEGIVFLILKLIELTQIKLSKEIEMTKKQGVE
jgi:hypothetical protein